MDNAIQMFNPIEDSRWNERVLASKNSSIFHSSNWAHVLSEAYHYTPLCFSIIRDNTLPAVIPIMEINSIITGKRGVSLPFTDYCDPIVPDASVFEDLLGNIIEHGRSAGWKSIELRTESALPSAYTPSSEYYGHVLDISRSEEELYSQLRDSTRRNIKKAFKEGVEVVFSNTLDAVKEFYRLNCMTRRDHGLPPQPYLFFKKVHEHVLSKDLGHIALASYNGRNIAGAVFFHFNNRAVYKYGASDKRFLDNRANNLIMWEAIRWYRNKGYTNFSFGRTEPENEGLLQFKRGWGAKEYPIYYYKYDLGQNAFIKDDLKLKGVHNRIFKRMPLPLLKLAGSMLYRHMG